MHAGSESHGTIGLDLKKKRPANNEAVVAASTVDAATAVRLIAWLDVVAIVVFCGRHHGGASFSLTSAHAVWRHARRRLANSADSFRRK